MRTFKEYWEVRFTSNGKDNTYFSIKEAKRDRGVCINEDTIDIYYYFFAGCEYYNRVMVFIYKDKEYNIKEMFDIIRGTFKGGE